MTPRPRPRSTLSLPTVTLVLLLVLAACGDDGDIATVSAEDAPQAAESAIEEGWTLEDAAAPYEGVTISAPFLNRPGYEAAIEMIPEFEERTGISVEYEVMPYENSREIQVLDFTGGSGDFDVVLIDLVWIGEFAASGWIVPLEEFFTNPELVDPELDLDGFFPVLLDAFGTWDDVIYGLPFDNYGGLLYYNECMLEEAGFDGPPDTWMEVLEDYGPRLTQDDQYAFALQSRRGETQSADSFARFLWPWGGSFVDEETFEPRVDSEESIEGLEFRQDLMEYMPPGIVEWDHAETVQGMAQGQVAMITEWSDNYARLADPESSTIIDCLGVTVEPAGPAQRAPALGGFSLGVNANADADQQAAAWLFIQWITSEENAEEYIRNGGVSARTSAYENEELVEEFPYFEPLVETWEEYGNPAFRPRFAEWPRISEIVAQYGSAMMLGELGVEEGAEQISTDMREILERYIEGDAPRIQ